MKKTIWIMIAVLTLGLLAGCGKPGSGEDAADGASDAGIVVKSDGTVDLNSFRTIGEAAALQGKDEGSVQRATYEGIYVYAFSLNGVLYRVTAELPEEVSKKLFELEYDDDYEKNEMALVSELPITKAENLDEQKLTQEELDALVGKTGQELFESGWRSGMFYNTETMEVWLEYGPFSYVMHFDGTVDPKDAEEFDVYEGLADMKVKDAAFQGIGDATFMEDPQQGI